jgi:hypothetical protein
MNMSTSPKTLLAIFVEASPSKANHRSLKTASATRLLLILILTLVLPAALQAQFDYSTNNGTITINRYTGPGGPLVIPETIDGLPVTSIGDMAFDFYTSLGNVTLPNSITNLGERAFGYCTNMSSINIPNGVLSIGNGALGGDFRLTSMTIPDSVIKFGDGMFHQCSGLTNITIGAGVTNLASGTFTGCTSLKNITVDARNTAYASIDGVLFNKSRTTLIQYPVGRTGYYAIPTGVTNINAAFTGCAGLNSVDIPEGVLTIADYAFYGTGLTGVIIPASTVAIGSYAFYNCQDLYGVHFMGNPPGFGVSVFTEYQVTYYRLVSATGWEETPFGKNMHYWDPALWFSQPSNSGTNYYFQSTYFGFPLMGTNAENAIVEACTNLSNPVWIPVGVKTFSGSNYIFSDPEWTNYPGRFYRVRNP